MTLAIAIVALAALVCFLIGYLVPVSSYPYYVVEVSEKSEEGGLND